MSPSTREPKYAYGGLPMATPSGRKPSGSWMVVGAVTAGCAEAGAAPIVTASAVSATIAKVRPDTGISLSGWDWAFLCAYPTGGDPAQIAYIAMLTYIGRGRTPRRRVGVMGAGHDHGGPTLHAGARHRGRLWWAAGLLTAFMVVETVAALLTGSLALLSDAGHMFTDVLGIAMALAAITAAGRAGTDSQRTFGLYRLEVLAALANALLLTGVAGVVLVQAVRRLTDPPAVPAGSMLVVAVAGLVVNVIAFGLLRTG